MPFSVSFERQRILPMCRKGESICPPLLSISFSGATIILTPKCSEQVERMANSVCEVLLTKERLEEPASAQFTVDLDSGAVVDFRGVVRSMEDGREIEGVEYEAHQTM